VPAQYGGCSVNAMDESKSTGCSFICTVEKVKEDKLGGMNGKESYRAD